jgi:YesN/AraC family two-component response regulator
MAGIYLYNLPGGFMAGTTILIVDDDINLLDGLKRSMREKQNIWNQVYASSANEALNILASQKIDVIITDYKMPGVDGLELLSIIKEKYPDTKRILLTGQSENEVFESAKDIAHLYLSKPCPVTDIINAIDKIIIK